MISSESVPVSGRSDPAALETWLEAGREVLRIEREGLEAVAARLDASFVAALRLLAGCGGRVAVMGIGKSGLVGRKLAATFSSTGTPAFFLHPVESAHGDMGSLRPGDVALAISNSGETAELLAILPAVRTLGVRILALTGRPDSTLGRGADVTLDAGVPREACPHGLAPTASTTAALALGDALAVCLMRLKAFSEKDFLAVHPGGSLGLRLRLSVRDVMRTSDLPCCADTTPQRDALELLDRGGLGALVLLDEAELISGILTDGDVRRAVCRGVFRPGEPVRGVMTRSPRCGSLEDSVATLLDIMEARAITVLPIAEKRRLIGVVHMHDLLGQGHVSFSEQHPGV